MSSIIWRNSSLLLIPKFRSHANRIILKNSRLNSSNFVPSNELFFKVHRRYFKKFDVKFCPDTTSKKKIINSITTSVEYEEVAEETLQSIGDRFEELLEDSNLNDFDVTYSNDVLTVALNEHGTYVINKQSPNKQIWLSSPFSGPKRYDYVDGTWIYKHDGKSLHHLLSEEMSSVVQKEVNFMNCAYSFKK